MKYKDLQEIGWGIYKYKGELWVATEDNYLENQETGEVEQAEEGSVVKIRDKSIKEVKEILSELVEERFEGMEIDKKIVSKWVESAFSAITYEEEHLSEDEFRRLYKEWFSEFTIEEEDDER